MAGLSYLLEQISFLSASAIESGCISNHFFCFVSPPAYITLLSLS
ncbi:hypothetical protein ASZ90_006145 [hydrocarbon metagenome]|uniref:Uncharacterized protein n=1 Tax=hydrocarbon metagenome TaxID=938273 RepID=A0A0W8FTL6_9ZZZZ